MSIGKSNGHKKNRAAGQRPKRWFRRNGANEQELVGEPPNDTSPSAIEQTFETSSEMSQSEIGVESLELSDSLAEFAADDNRESSTEPETEPDGSKRFYIVDDPINPDYVVPSALSLETDSPNPFPEAHETNVEQIDTSKWFEHNGADTLDEFLAEQHETLSEKYSLESASADTEVTSDDKITDGCSSTTSNGDEADRRLMHSGIEQAREPARDERRKHPREASTDLVWVEYFNSSMECAGKEAARVENFGAGGMRVTIKAAPPELERVIVSYAYRGFESCSLVRSRYPGENGKEHLCLEFVDREWKVNPIGEPVENRADQGNPRKILIADDDSAFRKILGNILIKAGYDVVLAEDGERAVEKATSEKPDLVITDGLMPKLHGFEVCKAIKELNPRTKVIMLSAVYTSANFVWEARAKFGADEMITKPCQIADLLRKIEKHIPASCYVA
jgi:CheY-like chemotaxis protein